MMNKQSFYALSPIDGRYCDKLEKLQNCFSEAALIEYRVKIEIFYLLKLSHYKIIRPFSLKEQQKLIHLLDLDNKDIALVKEFEDKTHHDVKAVEYYLREKFKQTSLKTVSHFLHFGLTSEDVNNLTYRLMIDKALKKELIPWLIQILKRFSELSWQYKDLPMLARTHGQAAIPTTLGKELSVFLDRLLDQLKKLGQFKFAGKLNGAVGGLQALSLVYPKVDWLKFSRNFVKNLDFRFVANTTQINPCDDLLDLFAIFHHINSILLGLNQDIWRYISDDWLIQKSKEKFVGSSTMPQKINPIEFENSEGNLEIANGLFEVFSRNFGISRLQRDLSDSTVYRNIGVSFGHCVLAYQSLMKGLDTIEANQRQINMDLNKNWNILAEALQVMARKNGNDLAYEQAANLMKNKLIKKTDWQKIVSKIDKNLVKLTVENYLGLSIKLTEMTVLKVKKFIKS